MIDEDEEWVDAIKPGTSPTDKELFDDVTADISGFGVFERRLSDAVELEDVEYAHESAFHLRTLAQLLGCDEEAAARLDENSGRALRNAQALLMHSVDGLFLNLSSMASVTVQGDTLNALSALIEASFYIGSCSTTARQAGVKKQGRRQRRSVERRLCVRALKELYSEDPRNLDYSRERIRSDVASKVAKFSPTTLDRAIEEVWPRRG